jgi:hypothetical protein
MSTSASSSFPFGAMWVSSRRTSLSHRSQASLGPGGALKQGINPAYHVPAADKCAKQYKSAI